MLAHSWDSEDSLWCNAHEAYCTDEAGELENHARETLNQINRAITEIDLVLHQWQEDLDMMSFIGVNATFELWTTDIPPRLVTKDVLSQAAGKELRVMHRVDGAWTKVGTAKVDKNGLLTAQIERDVPELLVGLLNAFSIDEWGAWKPLPSQRALEPKPPVANFKVEKDGSIKQYVDWNIDAHQENLKKMKEQD